jgi:hypothetical protein
MTTDNAHKVQFIGGPADGTLGELDELKLEVTMKIGPVATVYSALATTRHIYHLGGFNCVVDGSPTTEEDRVHRYLYQGVVV